MDIGIGSHCNNPYDCLLIDKCWSFLPERNVFLLYSNNRLPMTLMKRALLSLLRYLKAMNSMKNIKYRLIVRRPVNHISIKRR